MSTNTHAKEGNVQYAMLPFQTILCEYSSLPFKAHTLIPNVAAVSIHLPAFPWPTAEVQFVT